MHVKKKYESYFYYLSCMKTLRQKKGGTLTKIVDEMMLSTYHNVLLSTCRLCGIVRVFVLSR